jgi:hypothetical protein
MLVFTYHIFNFLPQVALSGTSYSFLQRIGAIVVCTVWVTSVLSFFFSFLWLIVIKNVVTLHSVMDPSFLQLELLHHWLVLIILVICLLLSGFMK